MIKCSVTNTCKLKVDGVIKSIDDVGINIESKEGLETLEFDKILKLFKDKSVKIIFDETSKEEIN